LDSWTNRKHIQYLVKWTGYPREEATWESWGNVKNSPNRIKEFHARYPTKPRDLKAVAQLQIRRINYDGWDPHLYHPRDGTPGESHTVTNGKTRTDWTAIKPELEIKKILEQKQIVLTSGKVIRQPNDSGSHRRKTDTSTHSFSSTITGRLGAPNYKNHSQ
jgi:hypothetical protein